MAITNKAVVDFASQATAAVVIGAATFSVQILMARQLGPVVFGIYGIANAIAVVAYIVQDGGFKSLLYREGTYSTVGFPCPQELFRQALGWNILATLVMLIATGLSSSSFNVTICAAVAIIIVGNAGRAVSVQISSLIRADNLFVVDAKWQMQNRVLVSLATSIATIISDNLLAILSIGGIVQLFILFLPAAWHKLRGLLPKFYWNHDVLKVCFTLVSIDFVTAVYFRSDVLIMAAVGRTKEEIGIYSALCRIMEAYIFAVTPIATILFRSARLSMHNRPATIRTLGALSALVGIPTIAILAFTACYSSRIVDFIFGEQFSAGAHYLVWLIAACCAAAPNALIGQVLLAGNRERYFLMSVIGALVVNLTFNAVLIPIRGAEGAAQATFATEIALLTFLLIAFLAPVKASVQKPMS